MRYTKHNTHTVIILITVGAVLFLIFKDIHKLRPLADDYCAASISDRGPIVAARDLYLNWWGDITSLFLYSLFVGIPLRLFGSSVGSIIPFVTLCLCVVFFGRTLYNFLNQTKEYSLKSLLAGLTILVSWITYWQSWSLLSSSSPFEYGTNLRMLSASVVHWKTVQIVYLFTSLAFVTVFFLIYKNKTIRFRNLMLITSGLFLGTSSYIFSTSFGVSFLIYFIVYRLKSKLPLSDLFVFGSSTLIAFLFSFFSPGSTFRRNNLKNLPIENLSMGDSFHRWAGTMASFVFSGSFLATLAFGIIFYNLFLSKVRSSNFGTKLDSWILQLIIFVLICSFFTSVANYNIGWSPWHALYWAMAVWLLAFVMGLRLGTLPILQINKNILFFTILIFASVVSIQAALKVSASINDRWLAWEKGPAPIAGLEDREVEWVRNCISTRIYES